ncbi:MAG: DUF1553 domain-containing protein [Cyclobacteriaceae bacterium]
MFRLPIRFKYERLKNMRISLLLYAFIATILVCCNSEPQVSFNKDIRPILNENCLACHGGVKASGGFSLLFEEDVYKETKSGKSPIVSGNAEKSEVIKRITHSNPDLRMPFGKDPLSQEDIDLITKWINQGAKWEKHWAYIPPRTDIEPPEISDESWASNSIDNFIFSKLEEKELSPAEEADKYSLMRRVYLDLTGLPPTLEQARSFLEDTSENAFEELVDKLMASEHFGERWASMWLDLARYADSKGYEKDSNREIWKYRDWVVEAFNRDLPYDQFTIEQLAGDMLDNPKESQLIATAFHRNSMANDEGGTDDEEFRVASVIDRVNTTYEVWQGTTMSCVQCHSHPYDPFRHENYYQSMAYFNNSMDKDIYHELPKFFSYTEEDAEKMEGIISWINSTLEPEDRIENKRFLSDTKESLLYHLGHRVVEAENYYLSSPLIELISPTQDMVWQVQDSSWIKFEDVDLTKVNKIGFDAATQLNLGGRISIHLDSLTSPSIGEVKITKTGEWKSWSGRRPNKQVIKEFQIDIPKIDGKRDIYYRFWVGDTYIQHLFYVDKIIYHEEAPRMDKYGDALQEKIAELKAIPNVPTPILKELKGDKRRKTFRFDRGSWLSPAEEVSPVIPAIFLESTENPDDRLQFAKWLVSDDNPLSARVAVNRIWEQLFGSGLVESMEEFGSQGTNPTHPELLDWMAVRFKREHGWKFKSLIREIVLSSTYRQSSVANEAKLEKDPLNQWLSRGPRTRLSGEQIRDQILAVSGLLDKKMGGPSVILPHWEKTRMFSFGGIPQFAIRGDSAKYRRTLYSFWKRTDPFPSMMTFDSPDRTVCTSRRIRTNTPLQALNMLNDQTYFEASKALANKLVEKEMGIDEQIQLGYEMILFKEIDERKLQLLKDLYQESYQYYEKQNESGLEPKLAAMTLVANAMMNLDEFIVKG